MISGITAVALAAWLAHGSTTVPEDSRQHDFYLGGAIVAVLVAADSVARL